MDAWAIGAAVVGAAMSILIFIQDIRGRWVHLLPLVALFGAGLLFRLRVHGSAMWPELAANAGFVTVIMVLVWALFRVKDGGKLIGEKLGLGDVLMFYAIATWLDSIGFMFFYVTSMLIILVGVLIYQRMGKAGKDYPIPLAGLMALYLVFYVPGYYLLVPGSLFLVAGS